MSIIDLAGIIGEITELNMEIDRLQKIRLDLVTTRKKLEQQIKEYLVTNKEEGVRCGDTLIILDEKNSRKRRKKSDKMLIACDVLKKHGINDADRVMTELNDAIKGEQVVMEVVKIKKSKKS